MVRQVAPQLSEHGRVQGCPNADASITRRHRARDARDKRTPINGRRPRSETRQALRWARFADDRVHKRLAVCTNEPPRIAGAQAVRWASCLFRPFA